MSLDKALSAAQTDVPECVAVGYVDMSSGFLLGVKTVDSHPGEILDLVAAATGDLFQGKNVTEIERLFDQSRGITNRAAGAHYFNEIVVFSTNLIHGGAGYERSDHRRVSVHFEWRLEWRLAESGGL